MLGVGLGGGFDLDEDDLAAGGDGERGEGFGVLGLGVTDSADHCSVGTQEILLDETLADAWKRKEVVSSVVALEVCANSCRSVVSRNSPLLAPETRTTDMVTRVVWVWEFDEL